MSLLWKGILIGLLFGVPVGAVGAMTVQRTWEHGIRAGLLTGMGSSVADCIYAGIGAFGLTMVSDFLLEYQTAIHLAGGAIVLFLGIRLLLRKRGGRGSGCVRKMEDVPDIICGRDHESGGNIDIPVCLFLVWDCGRKRIGKRMAGGSWSADRDLSLVGRT